MAAGMETKDIKLTKQPAPEERPIKLTRKEKPMIYAVDFDGVIVEDAWPKIGKERPDIVAYLKACRYHGHRLILWTCRTGKLLEEAVNWCGAHGLRFDAINANLPDVIQKHGGDTRKIHADWYIDDRSLRVPNIGQRWYWEE